MMRESGGGTGSELRSSASQGDDGHPSEEYHHHLNRTGGFDTSFPAATGPVIRIVTNSTTQILSRRFAMTGWSLRATAGNRPFLSRSQLVSHSFRSSLRLNQRTLSRRVLFGATVIRGPGGVSHRGSPESRQPVEYATEGRMG